MTNSEVQVLRQEIAELTETLSRYIEADDAWKVRAEPVVKAFENSSWLFKLFITFLKTIGLMGGAGAIIYSATRFIKNI